MATTAASRKAKGRRLQQWVCEAISKLTGIPWGPDCEIASREMGQNGVDVRLIGRAKELFPYSVECKNTEAWSVPAWIEQARKNTMDGTDWLIVAGRNHFKPVVIIDAEVFFNLLRKVRRRS